jgi:hemolysin activation/secretion protein
LKFPSHLTSQKYNIRAQLSRPSGICFFSFVWVVCFTVLCFTSFDARADDARDLAAESSRERTEQWRREQNQRAAVLSVPTRIAKNIPVSGESPCFLISRVELTINDWEVGGYG